MNLRERTQEQERQYLGRYATLACSTRGREEPRELCDLRTEFQRDRDRVIHCKAFRRLKHKTQCFLAPEGDHYRTRLTHTLEVAQIARTISRALRLNEDLTEAIALAHDLGHTPFGHMGERTLRALAGHFEHNEQSLRVVERLERLNLTWEVRDGILNHTSAGKPATPEGEVVSLADRVAYINHDIDDAVRAGVISPDDIPRSLAQVLGATHSGRIDTMIRDVINASENRPHISMSPRVGRATADLREFMFERVYKRPEALDEEKRTAFILERLYSHFMAEPETMPAEFVEIMQRDGVSAAVCDHIAAMTDRYAVNLFNSLFMPMA